MFCVTTSTVVCDIRCLGFVTALEHIVGLQEHV